ncbi:MAG TPA: 1-deoxy-D-xylulose-5-phosphate reductoisomerase [Opitutales bacterium]|nr:1-deoxy-D-xylulose-5-phosphate reductoisomerase [Opitutales bacterium]
MNTRGVAVIGATGSIGKSALRVIAAHPDRLRLVGAANLRQADELAAIGEKFGAKKLVTVSRDGEAALVELATMNDADVILMAAGGPVCLKPTLAAIAAGKTVALASKEVLVMAGGLVMEAARRQGVRILPVDSEHNAIFQCLDGRSGMGEVKRLILTASGGPFRDFSIEELASVTPEQALRHPNWSMGPKITVDSATMANKGLEMMEARWLFDAAPEIIDVVVHPQSIVHSMVEFADGAVLAQLAPPSMTFAIQHALLYPERLPGVDRPLDFTKLAPLTFQAPDERRFRTLALARSAMQAGGTAPAVFNAANEVAVEAFLKGRIPFLAIADAIAHTLNTLTARSPDGLDDIMEADREARRLSRQAIEK